MGLWGGGELAEKRRWTTGTRTIALYGGHVENPPTVRLVPANAWTVKTLLMKSDLSIDLGATHQNLTFYSSL